MTNRHRHGWVARLLRHLLGKRGAALSPASLRFTQPPACPARAAEDWWCPDSGKPILVSQEIIHYIDRWAECDMTHTSLAMHSPHLPAQWAQVLTAKSAAAQTRPLLINSTGFQCNQFAFTLSVHLLAEVNGEFVPPNDKMKHAP